MGRKENVMRMKKMRKEKLNRIGAMRPRSEDEQVSDEDRDNYLKQISPGEILIENGRRVKFSEILTEFVSPYINECEDYSAAKELFYAGNVSWNLALTKKIGGHDEYEKVLKTIKIKTQENTDAGEFIAELVERKEKHFARYNFFFSKLDLVEESGGKLTINVMVMPAGTDILV